VHILVQCPHCLNRYKLEENLRAQMVRCPTSSCGKIFKVPETAPIDAPPAVQDGGRNPPPVRGPGRQVSGSVGGIVPLLGAEAVSGGSPPAGKVPPRPAEPVSPAPRDPPSWQQQAPPVRSASAPPAKPRPPAPAVPPAPAAPPEAPLEAADWRQQPPPRQGSPGRTPEPPQVKPRAPAAPAPPPRRAASAPEPPAKPKAPAKNAAETMRAPPSRAAGETMRVKPADTEPAQPEGPIELGPGSWDAPPVRRPGGAFGTEQLTPGKAVPEVKHELLPSERRRKRTRWIIGGLAVLVGAAVAVAVWYRQHRGEENEDNRYQQAQAAYKKEDFPRAAREFQDLEKDFPKSGRLKEYHFFGELSEVRMPAYILQSSTRDMKIVYDRIRQFVRDNQENELLKKVRPDIGNTLHKLVDQMVTALDQKPDLRLLRLVRDVLAEAREYRDDKEAQARVDEIEKTVGELARKAEKDKKRKDVVAQLKKLARKPSGDAVRAVYDLLKQEERNHPGLAEDAAVAALLDRLADAHRGLVKYTPAGKAAASPAPDEDTEPSLLVAPAVGGLGFKPWPRYSPVLALARGVLYVLRPSDGSVRWARRVGIDTTALPVLLPAFKSTPELILVLSSDTKTLSALDAADGRAVWHHRLSDVCLAQPTVVERRIHVPCYNGRVDVVEADTGKLKGHFNVGQHLSLGGAYDEDSGLLYLPADSYCVYVLDLNKERCAGILYSGHSSGSLRSDPVIVRWKDVPASARPNPDAPRSCLILSQADGLGATQLRAFQLPVTNPHAAPLPLQLSVKGWSWFPPQQDDEKLAVVTDRGRLGVFGIKQKNNRDKPLYPLRDREFVLDGSDNDVPAGKLGRAQLVYFDASNFWALANGALHRVEIVLGPTGWEKRELWGTPLPLGSPLHAAQADPARKILFLVTRPPAAQACLASGVRAETDAEDKDKLKWQTQLGMVCQGEMVAWQDGVLVQDQRGGLFRFDTRQYKDEAAGGWRIHRDPAANPLDSEGARPLELLPVPGGAVALVRLGGQSSGRLIIRHFDAVKNKAVDHSCNLNAPLLGTPGAWADHLVFPMANGVLMRKQFPGGPAVLGPNWRAEGADDNAPGHVVPLGASDFLVADGSRGLIRMSWPRDDDNCKEKGREKVPARIVAAPAVLIPAAGKSDFRVLVADSDNQVTLFHGNLKVDGLERIGRIPLNGRITAGPFVLGDAFGCVVDDRRLVRLDPEKNQKEVWGYDADADIVGRPALVGTHLVVADQDGRFVAVDFATGKKSGLGYQLKANVVPAAPPVAFGQGRVFAPLTDGTVLLLSLQKLQGAAAPKRKK
jgi:outer membrane protein assembly factor BamB